MRKSILAGWLLSWLLDVSGWAGELLASPVCLARLEHCNGTYELQKGIMLCMVMGLVVVERPGHPLACGILHVGGIP
jgi:hypothetical protein